MSGVLRPAHAAHLGLWTSFLRWDTARDAEAAAAGPRSLQSVPGADLLEETSHLSHRSVSSLPPLQNEVTLALRTGHPRKPPASTRGSGACAGVPGPLASSPVAPMTHSLSCKSEGARSGEGFCSERWRLGGVGSVRSLVGAEAPQPPGRRLRPQPWKKVTFLPFTNLRRVASGLFKESTDTYEAQATVNEASAGLCQRASLLRPHRKRVRRRAPRC